MKYRASRHSRSREICQVAGGIPHFRGCVPNPCGRVERDEMRFSARRLMGLGQELDDSLLVERGGKVVA